MMCFRCASSATYVNEALRHESCIDYVLVSDPHQIIDYAVVAPDINFSGHLPLAVVMKGGVSIDKQKCDSQGRRKLSGRYGGRHTNPER